MYEEATIKFNITAGVTITLLNAERIVNGSTATDYPVHNITWTNGQPVTAYDINFTTWFDLPNLLGTNSFDEIKLNYTYSYDNGHLQSLVKNRD